MKKDISRHTSWLLVLAILISVSVFFSGCSLFKKDTKDIEEAVDNYFEELTDGTLVEEDYESDYADDAPFAEIYFEDDTVIPVMHKVLELVEYEIGEVDGSEKEEEATCEVILTAPDIEEIIDSLDEGFTVEELEDALTDKKAPTEEHEIELELEYDDEWIILDTSEIAEILAEPFEDITFGPNVEDAEVALQEYFAALASGDVDTINRIGEYYDADLVYNFEDTPSARRLAYYGKVTFAANGSPEVYTDYVDFTGILSQPDSQAIVNAVGSDVELLATILKPELLNAFTTGEQANIDVELAATVEARMLELLEDPSFMIETEVIISLYYDSSSNQWLLSWLPTEVYSLASEPENFDVYLEEAKLLAVEQLFEEGEIDPSLYDAYMYELFGIVNPTEESYTIDDLTASFEEIAFYSWDLESYVSSFYADETTQMSSDLYFYDILTGAIIQYELYFNETLIDYQSGEVVPHTDGGSCIYFDFPLTGDSWTFEPGTYKAIFYSESGEVIADASIEMT